MSDLVIGLITGSIFILFLVWFGWEAWKESQKMKGMTDYERKRYLKGKPI